MWVNDSMIPAQSVKGNDKNDEIARKVKNKYDLDFEKSRWSWIENPIVLICTASFFLETYNSEKW